jgi:hypothetical protein
MFFECGNKLLSFQKISIIFILLRKDLYFSPLQNWLFLKQLLFKSKHHLLKLKPKIKLNEFFVWIVQQSY